MATAGKQGDGPLVHNRNAPRTTTWFTSTRRTVRDRRPRMSLLQLLDMALVDPPSLCCDDDGLCPACRADSAPELLTSGH